MRATLSRRTVLILAGLGSAGAIRPAQAAPMTMTVPLTGAQQVPPVQTPGTGTATITFDPSTRELTWSVTFNNLSGPPTMAHFHGPAPEGKNAPVKVWISKKGEPVTSPIKGETTLSEADSKELMAGDWYVNVHTAQHPGGEIRGQVIPPKS